jgi:putative transposase
VTRFARGVDRWRTLPSMKRSYQTDLTDAEWEAIEPHVPAPEGRGRPRTHTTHEILDAVFYVLKSGCPWRLLPRDFPPWQTVHRWFGRWRLDGTFERPNTALRERLRVRLGRDPLPSAGIPPRGYVALLRRWVVEIV